MPDTRKKYPVGTAIPGFQAGLGRINQKKQTNVTVGESTYRMHVTIEKLVKKGKWDQLVDNFHISVYDGDFRLNGCHWSFASSSDKFECKGWEKALAEGWDPTVTGKASTLGSRMKGTFGSSEICTAGSNVKG